MDNFLQESIAVAEKRKAIATQIVTELLTVLANKGVKVLRHDKMALIQDVDGYRIECHSEISYLESFNLKTPFEVVMLVLGNSWDVELDAAFEAVLAKFEVITPAEILSIADEPRQKLAMFRNAIHSIMDRGFEPKVVPFPTANVPAVPEPAPMEGELVEEEEAELPSEHYAGVRAAKASAVEYKKIEPLLKGAVVTQIVLYPSADDEKTIIFPDRTASAEGQVLKQDLTAVTYDRLLFVMSDGTNAMFQHHQDCCENVYIEDIEGDFMDLIGRPLIIAEEASHSASEKDGDMPKDSYGSETWTFYRFGGLKGMVVVRWMGSSNGYYGEGVDCDISHGGKKENALGHDE